MAKTSKNNIYYNDDEDSIADVLADMKKLAESTDKAIENAKYNDKQIKQDIATLKTDNEKNKTNITNIEKKSTEQDKSISNNTKSIEELQAENKALKEENRIIKEQIPGAAASGNSIHLEDSSNLEMNWKIKDGHRQETREGYNLLDTSNVEEKEYDGIRVTRNSDGSIKFKGTATKDFAFTYSFEKVLNGTYQESMQVIGTINDSTGFISSTIWNGGTNLFGDLMLKSNSTQILNKTFAENTNITHAMFYVATGAVLDCTIYPLLYKFDGTTKSYEQYGASPSPSFPSKIKTVGNNINFINMEDSEEKTSNGMTYSIKNNVLKIKGTATANNTLIFTSKTQVDLKANTYTLNANKNGSLTGVFGYYIYGSLTHFGARKVLIDGGDLASSTNTGIKTQTLTENNYYNCCFSIYFAKNCTTDMTLMPKLEKGSIATPYSPYGMGSVEIDVVNKNYLTKAQQQTKTFNNVNFEINENGEINIQGLANASGEVKFELERPCKMSDLINKIVELIVEGTHTATIGMRFLDGNTRLFELIPNSKTVTLNLDDNYINKNITAIQFYINITADYNLIIKPGIYAEFQTEFTPHQSQTAIMPIQQEMLEGDYVADVEHHEWGKIESYNNEEINTEYISTTGELSQGATVYYKLETPVDLELTEEQKAIRDTKLYTYKNITNIAVSDELASIDVEYKKDQNAVNKNFENRLAALETASTSEEA